MPEDLLTVAVPPHRVWHQGGARPVLALHCSLAHAGAWAGLAAGLHGVTITATDQIGHGRAADWDGVSDLHAEATQSAVAMAEAMGDGAPVDFIGHSFGGTVALRVALERPDLVRSLALVEPVIFAAARVGHAATYDAFRAAHLDFAARVAAGDFAGAAAQFHGHWGTGERFADLPARTQDYMVKRIGLIVAQNPVLLDDAAGMLRAGRLEAVQVPVLLIEGAESPAIIAAVHDALAARLPRVTRLAVPGAAHMVSITHASAVAGAVQAHLDGC